MAPHGIAAEKLDSLSEMMGERMNQLIETYTVNSARYMDDIRSGLQAGNLAQVEEAAHPLKSSSGNMGMEGLQKAAEAMEKAAAADDSDACDAALSPLEEAYTTVCGFLEEQYC